MRKIIRFFKWIKSLPEAIESDRQRRIYADLLEDAYNDLADARTDNERLQDELKRHLSGRAG